MERERSEAGKPEKTGYLHRDFQLFHLRDMEKRDFSPHYHDFHKLLLFLDGDVEYGVEGRKYRLAPYDFVLVNRYQIHKPWVNSNPRTAAYERLILYIRQEFLESFLEQGADLNRCFSIAQEKGANVLRLPGQKADALASLLLSLEDELASERYGGGLMAGSLFVEFMIRFNRACEECAFAFEQAAGYNKKIVEIMCYINGHLSADLSIDTLSSRFYISKYHMMRSFRKESGYSLHQYIVEKRLLKAKSLLFRGVPATAAFLECGFRDYSTFSRAFREKFGVSPSKVRERFRLGGEGTDNH